MKTRRFIARWFILILILAMGIGTFAALSMQNEKKNEAEQARPSSYLSNQRQHDIDMEYLAGIMGEYDSDASWRLVIEEDHSAQGPYISLRDDNKGFEGRIMYLKDEILIAEIDEGSFKSMPDNWKAEGEDKYAVLDCKVSDGALSLGYRGHDINFAKRGS